MTPRAHAHIVYMISSHVVSVDSKGDKCACTACDTTPDTTMTASTNRGCLSGAYPTQPGSVLQFAHSPDIVQRVTRRGGWPWLGLSDLKKKIKSSADRSLFL